jgi:hypothetical protein
MSSDVKEAPRHKMKKDTLTLVLCGNIEGHIEERVYIGLGIVLVTFWQ